MNPVSQAICLDTVAKKYREETSSLTRRVIVCGGTGCVASGSLEVYAKFKEAIASRGLPIVVQMKVETNGQKVTCKRVIEGDASGESVRVSKSGCQGFCQQAPLVTILPDDILYTRVRPGDVEEIVESWLDRGQDGSDSETLERRNPVERLLFRDPTQGNTCRNASEMPFYARQSRNLLDDCGSVDAGDIGEYISRGGYQAARDSFTRLTPATICEEVLASGLRGRGGGGFPTGKKWRIALAQPASKKYVICNGDEGDPGAFMDCYVMEGNPHVVLEGLMIAARAIEAETALVYVRSEYPLAVRRLREAIAEARRLGILGKKVFGSPHALDIEVMEGAGAFVCGEETALMVSVEGQRGMPRPKPPFPAERGLFGCPTVINNVETLAMVPGIIRKGANTFRRVGTSSSPGTKTFSLTGHVVNTGLIEVPFGTTLREIVYSIGGGVTDKTGAITHDAFKAVQIGGPSGGTLTSAHLDLPLDFDSLSGAGAMVGSGGLVVLNRDTCMVKIARYFMQFTQNESCGKCLLCREGTAHMLALLDDIIEGNGNLEGLALLEELALVVKKGSLCGLGKTAPNPVLSTLSQFRAEYEAHIVQKRCPSGECEKLRTPSIDSEKCRGCTLCIRKCPVGAISGERHELHVIDESTCTKCMACFEACKFEAIIAA